MINQFIRVGTRGSKLALIQTYSVLNYLKNFFPDIIFKMNIIKTQGDKFAEKDFDQISGKGIFVKEIEDQLLSGKIDLAVHSLKDLPTDLPAGLIIGAILKRDNPEDVLISKGNKLLLELPQGAKIGTSSLRRIVQLKRIRDDFQFVPLRGNVPTRIKKLFNSDLDAIVLARAGLERLKLDFQITEIFSPEVIIPAVGQGAIAVEIHKDNELAKEVAEALNDIESEYAVRAERAFLKKLGGGCRNPLSAFATIIDNEIYIDGFVATSDGEQYYRHYIFGNALFPEQVGEQLANKLLQIGASRIVFSTDVNT